MAWMSLPEELKRTILGGLPWHMQWKVLQVDGSLFRSPDKDAILRFRRVLMTAPRQGVYRLSYKRRAWTGIKLLDDQWTLSSGKRVWTCSAAEIEAMFHDAFVGAGRRFRVRVGTSPTSTQAF